MGRFLQVTLLYDHDLQVIPEVEVVGPCQVRFLTMADLNLFQQVRPMPPGKVEQFQRRFDRGDKCCGAWTGERLVHFCWVQTAGMHPIQPAGRSVTVGKEEFWIYDARTHEEARGRRIYPFVLAHILRVLRAEGFKRALVYTTRDNLASQRGIERVGFRLVERLLSVRLGSRWVVFRGWSR